MGKPINTAEYMESIDSRISANIAKWYSTDTVLSDKKTILSLSCTCPKEKRAMLIK
ncbi:hypothetical protein HP572_20640 [Pectobacterium sp. PL64]|uniref:hypothetical protein n=1 Tax=Pectobacterium sp. PL64 TaxID=2738983 RepID=UPI001F0C7AD8|nr:hypothetical protein [Pectobacterium sp. PL64]UMO87656.1 hypothetical protein HP572_20640 [Pectobacterium sp. PL64]